MCCLIHTCIFLIGILYFLRYYLKLIKDIACIVIYIEGRFNIMFKPSYCGQVNSVPSQVSFGPVGLQSDSKGAKVEIIDMTGGTGTPPIINKKEHPDKKEKDKGKSTFVCLHTRLKRPKIVHDHS